MLDFDDLDEAEEVGEATTEEQQEARAARQAEERRLAQEEAARRAAEEAERQRREAEEAEAESQRQQAAKVAEAQAKRYWRVVHSADAGGLVVSSREDKASQRVGCLAVGTVVLELQRVDNRLRYRFEAGNNKSADHGWVSIKGSGPWGKDFLKCLGTSEDWRASLEEAPKEDAEGSVQEALLFIDWDDTLCPTTFLQEHADSLQEPDHPSRAQLDAQAQAALRLLRKAASLGTVALVTLACREWVHAACRDFLPAIADEVASIDIFYAGEQNVGQVRAGASLDLNTMLKKRAMEQALQQLSDRIGPKTSWRNLVSIGDSDAECSAAKDLGRESRAAGQVTWTKTVKLREHPDLALLTAELERVAALLPELLAHEGSRSVDIGAGAAGE